MSTTPRKPPLVSWKTIDRVADEAREETLVAKSDEELTRELREAGFADDAADGIVDRALAANERRRPARRWIPALVAAAAVVLAVLAWKRQEVVAWWEGRPDEIGPDRAGPERVGVAERAGRLREEAYAACDASQWAACATKLDEARRLDPAGETGPRVVGARAALTAAAAAGDADVEPRKPRLK